MSSEHTEADAEVTGPDPQPSPAEQATPRRRRLSLWQESALLLALAVVLAVVIKSLFLQAFYIPSASMEPGLVKDDRILVQKISYWNGDPQRGDVIVFRDPDGWLGPGPELNALQSALSTVGLYPTGGHLVKRVIGVGGDEVVCCDPQGRVTVNGVPLDEKPYLKKGSAPSEREFEVEVPEGRLWVMGDNRANSEDSRFHRQLPGGGSIPESAVVGKVWAIVWPIGRWDRMETPETVTQSDLPRRGG